MGRPKRVFPKTLPLYDKLHTRMVKMYSGVEITALHLIKETEQYYISIDSWSFCCSKFKSKKKNTELQMNIPVVTDEKAVKLLQSRTWKNYIAKQMERPGSDVPEVIEILDRLFPDKEKFHLYELKHLVSGFCNGDFISYDKDGNIEEPCEHSKEQRTYYNDKFGDKAIEFPQEINELKVKFHDSCKGDNESVQNYAYEMYSNLREKYLYENYNIVDTLINVCKGVVVCPYIFNNATVKGSTYEHAGEIFFIVTPGAVYFETDRHF